MENLSSKQSNFFNEHNEVPRTPRTKNSPSFSSVTTTKTFEEKNKQKKLYKQRTADSIISSGKEPKKPIFSNSSLMKYQKKLSNDDNFETSLEKNRFNLMKKLGNEDCRKTPNFGIEEMSPIEPNLNLLDSLFSFNSKEKNFISSVGSRIQEEES